jgi:hypothetical protein
MDGMISGMTGFVGPPSSDGILLLEILEGTKMVDRGRLEHFVERNRERHLIG